MPFRAPYDEAGSPWWLRLQRAIGLVPLSLFAVFHLWLNWPALTGREAWLANVRAHAPGAAIRWCVLGLLVMHAALGVVRAWRRPATDVAPSHGRARFQALVGAVLLAFLIYHLAHVWPAASDAAHATPGDGYQALWQLLGRPVPLALYVLGCGALAFHLAHGWASWAETHALTSGLRLAVRCVAGGIGLVLFALYVQLVGRFALGEPVVPLERAETRGSGSE